VPPGPKPNPRYFFWTGNGDPKSAVADWQRSYRRLFKSADIRRPDGEIKRCHPHMFRDTFAVEMLLAGVPTCAEVCHITDQQVHEIEAKIRHVQRLLAELQRVRSSCTGNRPMADCRIIETLSAY
jgi:integrase